MLFESVDMQHRDNLSDIFSISNTSLFQSACFLWGVLGVVVGGDGFLNSSFYWTMMEKGWGGYSRSKRTNEATNAYNEEVNQQTAPLCYYAHKNKILKTQASTAHRLQVPAGNV